jgi:sulfur-oxidizing protein SoxA
MRGLAGRAGAAVLGLFAMFTLFALFALFATFALAGAAGPAVAQGPTHAPAAGQDGRRSGLDFMTPALQALQRDDSQNPAQLWLKDGEQRFEADCARCHGAASLRGVAARYPAFDTVLGKPVTLSARINLCRQRQLQAAPWAPESTELLAVEAYVGRASRGMPIAPPADPRLQPARALGRQLYFQRFGQLDLSCAQCHDANAGGRLGGSTIPQAHPTGYPIYRLEWQGLGSLQRRLRNCMTGVRAEPYAYGADEWTALESYLMQRAAGMAIDTPGVRP